MILVNLKILKQTTIRKDWIMNLLDPGIIRKLYCPLAVHTRISPTMELSKVEPVFVKALVIPDYKSMKEFEMHQAVCKRLESVKLLGVQRIGML